METSWYPHSWAGYGVWEWGRWGLGSWGGESAEPEHGPQSIPHTSLPCGKQIAPLPLTLPRDPAFSPNSQTQIPLAPTAPFDPPSRVCMPCQKGPCRWLETLLHLAPLPVSVGWMGLGRIVSIAPPQHCICPSQHPSLPDFVLGWVTIPPHPPCSPPSPTACNSSPRFLKCPSNQNNWPPLVYLLSICNKWDGQRLFPP